eukprot:m.80146 g.80146  ORF g.80146 m.80146 type:complete len:206 (-) comp25286_c1_seq1:68-685(-)
MSQEVCRRRPNDENPESSSDDLDTRRPRSSEIEWENVQRKHDRYAMRLDGEASVAMIGALLGGLALTMVPVDVNEASLVVQYVYFLSMCIGGALAVMSAMVSSTMYWAGMNLLSSHKDGDPAFANNMFRGLWKNPSVSNARIFYRRALHSATFFILVGITALVYVQTDDVTLSVINGALIFIVWLAASLFSLRIEQYTRNVTATS